MPHTNRNHNRNNRKKKTALIIGAVFSLFVIIGGAVFFYSRSTLPEAYPVGSDDGTETEGEGENEPGRAENSPESVDAGAGDTAADETGSSEAGTTDVSDQNDTAGSNSAEGITDVEYSPEYLAAVEQASEHIAGMTREEKVAQLFFVGIDALTEVGSTTIAGDVTKERLRQYPVGGVILFGKNITDPVQITEMTKGLKRFSTENGLPLMIGVDEEGGLVARIAAKDTFPENNVGAMMEIGNTGDTNKASEAGKYIGSYLKKYGFDIDFAPVADVYTNPENTVIGTRAFGTTPEQVSLMSEAFRKGLESQGVQSCIKHFPGHGDTQADSHFGIALTNKTLEELKNCELIPFQTAIDAGAELVMVSHISAPNVTGDMVPASLSKQMVTDVLREEMKYDGAVITDDLSMKAITDQYSPAEACVLSIQAGVDWVMVTSRFAEAYNGVLEAVKDGRISEERLNESVMRILTLKYLNGMQ